MAVVDVLAPASTNSNNFVIVPSGTAHGVLADGSDATYLRRDAGGGWVGGFGSHALPAGHGRHRRRISQARLRAEVNGEWQVTTSGGVTQIQLDAIVGHTAFEDYASAWVNSAEVFSGSILPIGQIILATGLGVNDVAEVRIEIDSRAAPAFNLDVLDGDMVSADPIVLTNQPHIEISALNLDGLPGRTWQIALYTLSTTLLGGFTPFTTNPSWAPVWSVSGTGAPPGTAQTSALPNDDYVVYAQVVSTVSQDTAHPSYDLHSFTLNVNPPDAPTVTVTVDGQVVEICADAAGEPSSVFDDTWSVGITRFDCGNPDGLLIHQSEQVNTEHCFDDCYAPLTAPGCPEPDECPVTYHVTLTGLVGGFEQTTEATITDPELVASTGTDRLIDIGCHMTVFCTVDKSWNRVRPSQAWQPAVGGYPTVTAGAPGGRNFRLNIGAARSDIAALETLLAQPVVFYSPASGPGEWLAPLTETVTVATLGGTVSYAVETVAVPAP